MKQISNELFDKMYSALQEAQESLTYFCGLHDKDDAGQLALGSVNAAINQAKKA